MFLKLLWGCGRSKCCLLIKLRREIIQMLYLMVGNTVQKSANQKHLGLILDEKLTFNDHITSKLTTVNNLISTLKKLYHYIPRNSLVAFYKSFIRPHLDYADVIFDKSNNATFSN